MIAEGRKQYLIADAIVFAIEAMNRLPAVYRRETNINELKGILNELHPCDLSLLQSDAHRLVNALLLGSRPFRQLTPED
jgi:hypothetical protein